MHLRQLKLRLGACPCRQAEVANDVPQSLSFRLVLCEHLALGVIADHLDIDEAAKVESFGSEHRHDSRLQGS